MVASRLTNLPAELPEFRSKVGSIGDADLDRLAPTLCRNLFCDSNRGRPLFAAMNCQRFAGNLLRLLLCHLSRPNTRIPSWWIRARLLKLPEFHVTCSRRHVLYAELEFYRRSLNIRLWIRVNFKMLRRKIHSFISNMLTIVFYSYTSISPRRVYISIECSDSPSY